MILHTGLMFACLVASTSGQVSSPCTSIDDTTSDQWCIENCLNTPAHCPQDKCTCEVLSSGTCVTVGGPEKGVPCVFPWILGSKSYNGCKQSGVLWCATAVDSEGGFPKGKWGICSENCPTDPGTMVQQTKPYNYPTSYQDPRDECKCRDPIPGTDGNHCDGSDLPNNSKYCKVDWESNCKDKYCRHFEGCYSTLACGAAPQPSCLGCECMDENKCTNQWQCNSCGRDGPFKICKVEPNSTCSDKLCIDEENCYAVTACACGGGKK